MPAKKAPSGKGLMIMIGIGKEPGESKRGAAAEKKKPMLEKRESAAVRKREQAPKRKRY